MKHWHERAGAGELGLRFCASAKPLVTVDLEKYRSYLDGTDMTDAQKEAFLQALWSIIVNFVELGFGVHSLQEVCGQNAEKRSEHTRTDFDAVCSKEKEECNHE